MSPSSIIDLISSKCCQNKMFERYRLQVCLGEKEGIFSMNKNMKNAYLVGCMISTFIGYDYHIANVLFCRKAFKIIHSIGNLHLSRIQT
jgi:hypothetical protein